MMISQDMALFLELAPGLVVLSCAICGGLCLVARHYAPRWGLVDRPGGHKGHRAPTPLGGGVAIWFTIVSIVALALVAVRVLGAGELPAPLRDT